MILLLLSWLLCVWVGGVAAIAAATKERPEIDDLFWPLEAVLVFFGLAVDDDDDEDGGGLTVGY